MKRYCKRVDILDRNLVRQAVYACLQRKWGRSDVLAYFVANDPLRRPKSVLRQLMRSQDKSPLFCIVECIVDSLLDEFRVRDVALAPIQYRQRYDTSCNKWREIGIQSVKQQMLDYVAVFGPKDIFRRIGEFQCASIPGRGQSYGVRAVKRWLRNKDIKYAWKGDIRQCFPSIGREQMMSFLRRYVANEPLLWLVDTLLASMSNGLSIGSYLSQWLCNLYLSQLYHFVAEDCWTERRGKRLPMAAHVLFYMDDILLLGSSRKALSIAARRMAVEAGGLGLEIKPGWRLWRLDDDSFIDIMGARIYRHHITVRRRVFRRLRRAMAAAKKLLDERTRLSLRLAQRIASYFGILKHTDSYGVAWKFSFWRSLAIAKEVIRNESAVQFATC